MLKSVLVLALEYGKHALDRGGLHEPATAGPGAADVIGRRLFAEFGVDAALVGMQGSCARSVHANDTADLVFGSAVNVEHAGISRGLD
jgi:hypothetical protein